MSGLLLHLRFFRFYSVTLFLIQEFIHYNNLHVPCWRGYWLFRENAAFYITSLTNMHSMYICLSYLEEGKWFRFIKFCFYSCTYEPPGLSMIWLWYHRWIRQIRVHSHREDTRNAVKFQRSSTADIKILYGEADMCFKELSTSIRATIHSINRVIAIVRISIYYDNTGQKVFESIIHQALCVYYRPFARIDVSHNKDLHAVKCYASHKNVHTENIGAAWTV